MECQHDFDEMICSECDAHRGCIECGYDEHGEPSEPDAWATFGFSENFENEWSA